MLLKKMEPRIQIEESTRILEEIDQHTFVVAINPDFPATQIVADITDEWGGPAGFLGGRIASNGLEFDGIIPDSSAITGCRSRTFDCKLYSTSNTIKEAYIKAGAYGSDPSSPRAYAMKKRMTAFNLTESPYTGFDRGNIFNLELLLKQVKGTGD